MSANGSYAYRVVGGKCVQYFSDEVSAATTHFTSANTLIPASLSDVAAFQEGVYFLTSSGYLIRMKLGEEAVLVAGPFSGVKSTGSVFSSYDGKYCYVVCNDRVHRYNDTAGSTTYQLTPTNIINPSEPYYGFGNGSGYDGMVWVIPRTDGSAQAYARDQEFGGVLTADMAFASPAAPVSSRISVDGGEQYIATPSGFYAVEYPGGARSVVRYDSAGASATLYGPLASSPVFVLDNGACRGDPSILRTGSSSPYTYVAADEGGAGVVTGHSSVQYVSGVASYGGYFGRNDYDFVSYPDLAAAPEIMFSMGGISYTPADGFAGVRIAPGPPVEPPAPTEFWTAFVGTVEIV